METYKAVLIAKFLYKENGLFFYRIEGSAEWLTTFEEQKKLYSHRNEIGELIHNRQYYAGKECVISPNHKYKNRLFYNLNIHLARASFFAQLNQNYWADLAKITKDEHWLTQSNTNAFR